MPTTIRKTGGKYAGLANSPLPGMILLDLNMPGTDGREALRHLKADPRRRMIPLFRAYDLGVNSFIVKPVTFQSLVDLTPAFGRNWFARTSV